MTQSQVRSVEDMTKGTYGTTYHSTSAQHRIKYGTLIAGGFVARFYGSI
jgi:hypothetical protein